MNQPRAQSFDMAMAIRLRLKINMLKGNLAHNFKFFHYMFVSCLLNVVKTLMTGNNENIDIVHIYREKKI